MKNATLYANFSGTWAANETNQTTLTSGQPALINVTSIPKGSYVWNVFVCDNAATPNCDFATANNTLNINSVGTLNVDISLPTNNTNIFQNDIEHSSYIFDFRCSHPHSTTLLVLIDSIGDVSQKMAKARGVDIFIDHTIKGQDIIDIINSSIEKLRSEREGMQ